MKTQMCAVISAVLLFCACESEINDPGRTPVSAVELADRIHAGSPPLILDVRSRDEFGSGHIPGAINIPHDELDARMAELTVDKSGEIVVHCKSGRRAQLAETILREHGYTNVRDLDGHWQEWQASGLRTE